jgi:hypothetical protein
MQDEDEQETEQSAERDPQKWSWVAFWSIWVAGIGAYFNLIAVLFGSISDLMDKHQDWKRDQADFARRAALEIEALAKDFSGVVP